MGPGVKHGFLGLRGRARKFSIADPQEALPLVILALEAHALGNTEVAMTHRSICLPDLPAVSQVRRYSRLDW